MNRYTGLVLCKHPKHKNLFLFQIPAFSYKVKEGDTVVVDTKYGEQEVEIVHILNSVLINSSEFNFILNCVGATLPLRRVISTKKVVYDSLAYTDESEGDDVNDANSAGVSDLPSADGDSIQKDNDQ